jgi:hypothetical protein
MTTSMLKDSLESLQRFRQRLYEHLGARRDASLNLLDSLCANTQARSVVELSLNPAFERDYTSLYAAIEAFTPEPTTRDQSPSTGLSALVSEQLPEPSPARPFWLLGVDTTPNPRPFAATLADRGVVYQPNPAPGNKPIAVGHRYSVVAALPQRSRLDPPWVVPLQAQRVASDTTATAVAAAQMAAVLADPAQPYGAALSVQVADSDYSHAAYLHTLSAFSNHVVIARSAGNRVYYRPAPASASACGHPTWYGAPFRLADPETWGSPSQRAEWPDQTASGRAIRLTLERWNDLLMRGHRDSPMQDHPFDVVRCCVFDAQTGRALFKRPLWLIVMGQRRAELSLQQIEQAYRQRFDLEHFFRFGKHHLLLDRFQTPDLTHEEHWWPLVCLAYVQLWLAAPLASDRPRPWERFLPKPLADTRLSPARVQRDFARLIRLIGTPARAPKRRGMSPGRVKGTPGQRRARPPIVFKRQPRLTATA